MYWEQKKNPGADLSRVEPLIFSISLTVTMLLAVFAFEWKTYDGPNSRVGQRNTNDFEEMMDVPSTEIPPPPAPAVRTPEIIEVPDEEKIQEDLKVDLDIEMTSETVTASFINTPVETKIEDEESEKIFLVVERSATPRDGLAAFYKYVSENIDYPAQAKRMDIQGRVFVQFVVGKDGALSQFEVVKGIGAGCDEEAVRIIQESTPWQPARQRGRAVKQRMVLPIFFKLETRL